MTTDHPSPGQKEGPLCMLLLLLLLLH